MLLLLSCCTRGQTPRGGVDPYPDDDQHDTSEEMASDGDAQDEETTPGDGDGDGEGDGDGDVPVRSPVPSAGAVFVHLFEWRWRDIAEECERYLGPAGFEAVQISPPSEHAVLRHHGFPWWQRYQTVSYSLEQSRSGTLADFRDMVQRCARVGVGIYVDAVINHMTAQSGGVGSAGSEYTKYDYPGLYTEADFHTPRCDIAGSDWAGNADNLRNCELLDLADLDTGTARVQDQIAGYLTSLVELGVRGFRIDAAKHTSVADLRAITGKVAEASGPERAPFYYFEVFTFGGEAVDPVEYLALEEPLGEERTTAIEFRFSLVGEYFRGNGKLATLRSFADGFMPSERSIVFINNHDTQRGEGLFYQDGERFDLATIYMLASPYGYPSLMSSFSFAHPQGRDRGPPSDANGRTDAIYAEGASEPACASESVPDPGAWVCEHRRAYVPGMLAFRRSTAGATVDHWWDNETNQIAFGRGGKGFVVINGQGSELERSFDTGLPEGRYCDAVRGTLAAGECKGRVIEVDGEGKARIEVGAFKAAALHVGAKF